VGLISHVQELFGSLFSSTLSRARRFEALGRLEEATVCYLESGADREAARVLSIRADAEVDPVARLKLLGHALALAPSNARELGLRRARLALELAADLTLRLTRGELVELGKQLEALGELAAAAEAYGLAGAVDAQARALVAAGAVERLEQVLQVEQDSARQDRERAAAERRVRDLIAVGRRREALALLETVAREPDGLAAQRRELVTRRVLGPRVSLELDGSVCTLVFGEQVIVGRQAAGIDVPSPCVSREHLLLRAGARGPEAVDLGSRNLTTLGGARLDAPLLVGDKRRLVLGGEVELVLLPWGEGGVCVEVGGQRYLAPLGPLCVGSWKIDEGRDRWLEVTSAEPLYLGRLRADARVELLAGDELRRELDGSVVLRVPG
jgi:tetratricopeptide (TPR) repeat protein